MITPIARREQGLKTPLDGLPARRRPALFGGVAPSMLQSLSWTGCSLTPGEPAVQGILTGRAVEDPRAKAPPDAQGAAAIRVALVSSYGPERTTTGVLASVVVPCPSCPALLSPQQATFPPATTAHE